MEEKLENHKEKIESHGRNANIMEVTPKEILKLHHNLWGSD